MKQDAGYSRRAFLGALGLSVGAAVRARAQQEPLAGQGETGSLRSPAAAGRPRQPATARDNDAFVKSVEHRLKCTCGCNLDVYTCRTTDFTCTVSPAMHREVLALQDQGKSAQEIIDAFVAEHGEQVLMAPVPRDFNLVGYLLPGTAILLAGAGLTVYILRRERVRTANTAQALSRAPSGTGTAAMAPTSEEMERLRRALAESED